MAENVVVSREFLQSMKNRFQSLSTKLAKTEIKAEESAEVLVDALVTGASAFAVGVATGRAGGPIMFLDVPIELWGAGLFHLAGLGFMNFAGMKANTSYHFNSVGNGLLAAYLVTFGRGVGRNWKESGKFLGGKKVGPSLKGSSSYGDIGDGSDGSTGQVISNEELQRLAASI